MKVAVNLAWTASHFKGGDSINRQDGALHAEWLEQAVDFYRRLAERALIDLHSHEWGLFVSVTGFQGWPEVDAGRERDALWRAFGRSRFVTMVANPGHQVGAAWCIRLGLEAAGKLGYDYMLHTAEDVIPGPGVLGEMVDALKDAEYAGEAWGPERNELNTQFFACRVPYLAGVFDPTKVPEHGHIEKYMAALLTQRKKCLRQFPYAHTHDYADWQRRIKAVTES